MADAWGGIPIVTGQARCLGLDAPAALLLVGQNGEALLPDLVERLVPGDVLVAVLFGEGCRDDRLPNALLKAGVVAVVASRLDPEFRSRACALGLRAVEIHEVLSIRSGADLRIDLEGMRVVNLTGSDRYPLRNLEESDLRRYRQGLGERP